MDMLITDMEEATNDPKVASTWLQGLYVFACVWSFGGILDGDLHILIDEFIKSLMRGQCPEYAPTKDVMPITINLPEGLIYDYIFICRGNYGIWKTWNDIIRNVKYEKTIDIGSPVIPTVDTARCFYMLQLHIKYNCPMILVGPTGTGKSLCVKHYLMHELSAEDYWCQYEIILSRLFRSGKNFYKIPNRRKSIVFLDDIHLPSLSFNQEQSSLELMRQYLDYQQFHTKELHPIYLPDMLLICAMQLPGSKKNISSLRFLSHFNIYSVSAFNEATLSRIFRSILQTNLMNHNFGPDIVGSVVAIVNATQKIYFDVKDNFFPTPAKCHYLFNLRDFYDVIQGCSLIYKETVDSRKVMIRLWTHEILRTFYDRILNIHEKDWLIERISWCITTYFKDSFENVFDYQGPLKGKVVHDTLKSLFFGKVLSNEIQNQDKKYEEMNIIKFQELAEMFMVEYNKQKVMKLDIIFFRYALEHLSRLCRIMTIPNGNVLLVGFSGLGKRSLTKLATFMMGYKYKENNIGCDFDFQEWRGRLKKILKRAGGKSTPIVLYLNDRDLKDYIFSDVESLLNSGEVPNLYTLEEKMELSEMVSRQAQGIKRTRNIDPIILYAYFIDCCRDNLHIVLSICPSNPTFREKIQNHPALLKGCSMDWFEIWPEEALERISSEKLGSIQLEENIKQTMIKTFARSMKKSMTEIKPELLTANEKSKEMMEIIERETAAVEEATAVLKVDEMEANEKAKSAQELKDDSDITLVKSMKNPPEAIKLVLAAITDYWGPSKKLMSDMSFLQKLKDYDKHNIPPEIMAKIRRDYIRNPMFKPKKVKKASRAAEGLCKWVLAMSNFDEVEKIVAPKREKLEIAEKEYYASYEALEKKRAEVQELENKILKLKSSLEATDEHRKQLQDTCELSAVRLNRAERLI
ncbi:hypothetical protein J437_LFUL004000, partial [Ladona fulva]